MLPRRWKTSQRMALESGKEVKSINAPHYVPKNTTMNLDKLNKWLSEN